MNTKTYSMLFVFIMVIPFCFTLCLNESVSVKSSGFIEDEITFSFPGDTIYPFQNTHLPLETRVDNLLSLLTVEEKIQLLAAGEVSIPRLGIKTAGHAEERNPVSSYGTNSEEAAVPFTQFCSPYGLAAAWDPEFVRLAAETQAVELRYTFHTMSKGGLITEVPAAGPGSDPRAPDNREGFGEDPWLAGVLTASFVKGLQGEEPLYWRTAALLKYSPVPGNPVRAPLVPPALDTPPPEILDVSSQVSRTTSGVPDTPGAGFPIPGTPGAASPPPPTPISGLQTAPSPPPSTRDAGLQTADERLFREYYSVPLRMGCSDGGADCYIIQPDAIYSVLRQHTGARWGVDGILCADTGTLEGLCNINPETYPTKRAAAAACLLSGITQFRDADCEKAVEGALNTGLINPDSIDTALRGNLRIMTRLGLFDPAPAPYTRISSTAPWNSPNSKNLSRIAGRKAFVLLKNAHSLLPLNRKTVTSIAVIGSLADTIPSSRLTALFPNAVTPFAGIREQTAPAIKVTCPADNSMESAIALARAAEVVLLCIGNTRQNPEPASAADSGQNNPGPERTALSPAYSDLNLIREVYKVNPRTIVVLISGYPCALTLVKEKYPAFLYTACINQELGNALADVLFGVSNPGGRLVQTWPQSPEQLPPLEDMDIRKGKTYMYFRGEPLYYFGYGLSYSTFTYKNLRTSARVIGIHSTLTVSADIKNSGNRDGEEVVQLYVKFPESAIPRPDRQLKGFLRIFIEAGKTVTVTLPLKATELCFWDANSEEWILESGEIEILLAGSADDQDIKARSTLTVAGNRSAIEDAR